MKIQSEIIPQDKLGHGFAGYAIVAFILYFFPHLTTEQMIIYSNIIALSFGTGKELFDKFINKGKFDIADLACTWAGGFLYAVQHSIIIR